MLPASAPNALENKNNRQGIAQDEEIERAEEPVDDEKDDLDFQLDNFGGSNTRDPDETTTQHNGALSGQKKELLTTTAPASANQEPESEH